MLSDMASMGRGERRGRERQGRTEKRTKPKRRSHSAKHIANRVGLCCHRRPKKIPKREPHRRIVPCGCIFARDVAQWSFLSRGRQIAIANASRPSRETMIAGLAEKPADPFRPESHLARGAHEAPTMLREINRSGKERAERLDGAGGT